MVVQDRYQELDSLRGIVALTVLAYHYFLVLIVFNSDTFGSSNWVNLLKYTPLHVFWAGYEAVLFFFVLSGFVLSLKFYSRKKVSYRSFLIKRWFRIYVPYYGILILALTLFALVSRLGIPGLSGWFNSIWVRPVTFGSLLNHLVLIRPFGYGQYIPVLWSLAVEVRISIIFPLLMLFIKKYDWKLNLLLGIGLAAFYYEIMAFVYLFILGALLAKHRKTICSRFCKLSGMLKIMLLVISGLLYTVRYWAFIDEGIGDQHSLMSDVLISSGIALLIILAFSTRMSGFLKIKPFVFLGKISYSIYLSHAVILITLIYAFYSYLPIYIIWLISLFVTIIASFVSYKCLEQPAIRVGRRFAEKQEALGKGKRQLG